LAVGQSFSVSTTTLVGQALGANDPDRAENITRLTRRLARMATFVVAVVFIAFGYYIALFYNGGDENAAQIASLSWPIFVIAAVNQYSQSVQMSTAGALRGAGDTMYPFYSSLCGIIISRIGLAFVFINVFHWGLIGAWTAFLLDQLTRSFIIRWRFNTGKWKQMKAIKEERSRKRMEKYNRE
jgi:Na+-driven multidrug efflux pump